MPTLGGCGSPPPPPPPRAPRAPRAGRRAAAARRRARPARRPAALADLRAGRDPRGPAARGGPADACGRGPGRGPADRPRRPRLAPGRAAAHAGPVGPLTSARGGSALGADTTAPKSRGPRRLATPRQVDVRAGEGGRPEVVGGKRVEAVRESWLVEDRWWSDAPLRRRYWEVVVTGGRNTVVFRDLVEGAWYEQASA